MAKGLRSLVHHVIRSSGVHRAGAGGIENPLTLPYVFDFDAETTGQTPSWVENTGTDTATVELNTIEGHAKALKLPGTNGAIANVDLGGNIDPTDGFRVQALGYRSALYAPKYMYMSPGTGVGEGDTNLVLAEIVESSTQATVKSYIRKDTVNYDTGQVQIGALNGTGNGWTYWRWQFDPADQMTFDSYNITGGQHSGYPKTRAHAAGWQTPIVGFDHLTFISASYYETRIAECWIGSLTDAWPTPGVPQS